MRRKRLLAITLTVVGAVLVLLGLAIGAVAALQDTSLPSTISGTVIGEDGPVAGAILQIQGTPTTFQTDENGTFTLSDLDGTMPIVLTAWSTGHFIGWITLDPGTTDWDDITITLNSLPQGDNSEYEWFSTEDGVEGSAGCGTCHREYTEWQADQHSRSAVNHRFLTLYTGTDVNGEQSQMTQWGETGALPADPNEPYYGPGFLLDNPGRAGNCAACHTPVASKTPNNQNCAWSGCHTNLTVERANGLIDRPVLPINLRGDAAEGITCEFCHVIGDVIINSETNLPWPDSPGILSLSLSRPSDESEQVFFGTLVDVTRPDSFLPLQSESVFCASCHYGVFGGVMGDRTVSGGTLIYNSYGEWLASPYSSADTGATCQDCHMPVSSENWTVYPEQGGIVRDYSELHNHTMPGAADENLLQNSVTMVSSAEQSGDQLQVQISITNDRAGHHVPTDSPIRSMILVVEALNASGEALALLEGPVNPDYSGDYGGLPGRTFAKVLRDDWTGETPTAAIWRPLTIVEDTRIAALATDTTNYTFDLPAGQAVTIDVRLIYRRAFYELMQQKGWNDPDILMEHETLQLPAN
jgi:hypothetical protein